MNAPVSKMSRGTAAWLDEVVARHGKRRDHLTVELCVSQAQLARDEGCSPGTIQHRVTVLENCGVLVDRNPLVVEVPLSEPEPSPSGPVGQPATSNEAVRALLAANEALAIELAHSPTAAGLEAQRHVLDALGGLSGQLPITSASETVDRAMESRESAISSRVSATRRELVSELSGNSKNSLTPSTSRDIARNREISRHDHEDEPDQPRRLSDETVIEIVEPLAELAENHGLVGLTDTSRLIDALCVYSERELRSAVSRVKAMTRAGSIQHSPLGWLVTAAKRNDPDLFTPRGHQHTTSRTPPPDLPDLEEALPADGVRDRVNEIRSSLQSSA